MRNNPPITNKAGKPWAGAVKNRRKNGDFYWVLASATPIWENGQVNGYMSVRTKLAADQRQEAEEVYRLLREKKALAEQTAKATGEISQQISSIQLATKESVAAIKDIGDTIGKMSEIASTIASAVEEQGAATQEIARNVQQAAQGTMEVSSNIVDVQRGTSETGSASSQVLAAAQSLSRDSNRLKLEVGKFLGNVRSA